MKKIIATAAFVAAAAAVTAQTVTSANIVGYNKATTTSGLVIQGTQFLVDDATPGGIFGLDTLAEGSKIYTFDGGYQISELQAGFGGVLFWNQALDLGQATGYFVETDGVYDPVVSGEVDLSDTYTNNLVSGLNLVSSAYPVATSVDSEDLNLPGAEGDKVYTFVGGSYQISTRQAGFGGVLFWTQDLPIGVGQGFWYESVGDVEWVESRPF